MFHVEHPPTMWGRRVVYSDLKSKSLWFVSNKKIHFVEDT